MSSFRKNTPPCIPTIPRGKVPFRPDAAIIDPLVALTFIAASTKRLRLGTGVNILPQMNALYLAKWASSIDHLSKGRLMLGVGIGWLREEFDAIGVPFAHRGKRADEYLQALKAVWSGEEVNFRGEFVNWQGFQMRPRPAQDGGVPMVIGGVTPAAIRRLVRYGDGWYVIGKDLDDYREHMRAFKEECKSKVAIRMRLRSLPTGIIMVKVRRVWLCMKNWACTDC